MSEHQCGRGWAGRCAQAKSPTCRCSCGGHNHGNPKARREDRIQPEFTDKDELYYEWDTPRNKRFTFQGEQIQAVRFTRIAGEPSPFGGFQRGDAVIELVFADHKERLEQHYRKHSDGMEFGYGGSGPADAALNILASFIPVKEATKNGLYQSFKFAFIANISQETGGEISGAMVRDWIADQWAAETLEDNRVSA